MGRAYLGLFLNPCWLFEPLGFDRDWTDHAYCHNHPCHRVATFGSSLMDQALPLNLAWPGEPIALTTSSPDKATAYSYVLLTQKAVGATPLVFKYKTLW